MTSLTGPKCSNMVLEVSEVGIVIMVLGIYLIIGYLDPLGIHDDQLCYRLGFFSGLGCALQR